MKSVSGNQPKKSHAPVAYGKTDRSGGKKATPPASEQTPSSNSSSLQQDQYANKAPTSQDTSSTVPFRSKQESDQLNSRRATVFNSRPSEDVSKLALVGKGSSIAYQLDSMPNEVDHSKTTLIGEKDAWSREVRGDGFVNHEAQQIDHRTDKSPRFSNEYMDRQEFVNMNQEVFDRARKHGARIVNDEVIAVGLHEGLVKIETKNGPPILGEKAILGTGAGPHCGFGSARGPVLSPEIPVQDVPKEEAALRGKVVDMDEYMRMFPRTPGMEKSLTHREPDRGYHVVIHGPRGGMDAVQRAWQHGAKITWLSGATGPNWLPGHRLPIKDVYDNHKDDPDGPLHFAKVGLSRPTVRAKDDGIEVSYTPTGAKEPVKIRASHYVIALGQDAMAPGAIGGVLEKGGIKPSDLEPIYDVNQIFGQPYQTALGLQLKGTDKDRGLQITGAAASALAAAYNQQRTPIQHNYDEQFPLSESATPAEGRHTRNANLYLKGIDVPGLLEHQINPNSVPEDLKAGAKVSSQSNKLRSIEGLSTPEKQLTTPLPGTIVSPQLGAVRSAVAAQHGYMPGYISQGKVNFSSDDRTMLAAYMTQKYPYLNNDDIGKFIQHIMDARATTRTDVSGSALGFTDEASKKLEAQLAALNEKRSR